MNELLEMFRALGLSAVLAAVSATASAAPRLTPGEPIPAAELEAFVDGVVGSALEEANIRGATVAVVQGGQPLLIKGYGHVDKAGTQPVDARTAQFRIGSVAKTFTWITVLQLVEAGRIDLDAPVNDYLPDTLDIPAEGFREPIRMRHLLSHSAGFEDRTFGSLFFKDFDATPGPAAYLASKRPRRVREPGRVASYSNYGAALAGHIAAIRGGVPDFQTLADQRLYGPAGLTQTTSREVYRARPGLPAPIPAEANRRSGGFRWTGSGFEEKPWESIVAISPAGSAATTAPDMARYMAILLADGALPEGGRLYGPATARAIRTPLFQTLPGGNGWGHGFVLDELPGGLETVGHNGATLFFYANMLLVPELGLGIFVAANTDTGSAVTEPLPARIVERFYGEAGAPPRPADPAFKDAADAYSGAYVHTRRTYGGLAKFIGLLTSQAEVTVDADGVLQSAEGAYVSTASPTRFEAREGVGHLSFALGADGRATGWTSSANGLSWTRLPWWRTMTVLLVVAGLATTATVLAWVGAFARFGRPGSATRPQRLSSALVLLAGAAWLVALGLLATFATAGEDPTKVAYAWPGPLMGPASALALAAAIIAVGLLLALPLVWRAPEGWSRWRKARHTATVASFIAFAALLADWGALHFWG